MNSNPVSLVNAFLGTKGAGNCLIGPYRPFGMVRVGPDSLFPNPNNGYQLTCAVFAQHCAIHFVTRPMA